MVAFEPGAHGVSVMADPAQIGIVFEQAPGHRSVEAELVEIPAQASGAMRTVGERCDERERCEQNGGEEQVAQCGIHGSKCALGKIPPTVAGQTIEDKILP